MVPMLSSGMVTDTPARGFSETRSVTMPRMVWVCAVVCGFGGICADGLAAGFCEDAARTVEKSRIKRSRCFMISLFTVPVNRSQTYREDRGATIEKE